MGMTTGPKKSRGNMSFVIQCDGPGGKHSCNRQQTVGPNDVKDPLPKWLLTVGWTTRKSGISVWDCCPDCSKLEETTRLERLWRRLKTWLSKGEKNGFRN